MAEITSLRDAVAALIHDGDTVAMEGFTHLIPSAAGHELIRQGRTDLRLLRLTPDIIYDQLIGVGAVRELIFSWGGNPGVGSLHRFRDAVEHQWPRPLTLVEHSHASMATAYAAGAAGLPFGVFRAARGSETHRRNPQIRTLTCPFTGEELTAVSAHRPDVTVIHAQRADLAGNVQIWGIISLQKEAALAAARVLVTVEEVVERLTPMPGAIVIPAMAITAVCEVPRGSHPAYAQGYTRRDNSFYHAWEDIARDRAAFTAWIDRHVRATGNMQEYLRSVGAA
jgi:glutaconate CoA-transferase subunit A